MAKSDGPASHPRRHGYTNAKAFGVTDFSAQKPISEINAEIERRREAKAKRETHIQDYKFLLEGHPRVKERAAELKRQNVSIQEILDILRWPPETGQVAKIESCP